MKTKFSFLCLLSFSFVGLTISSCSKVENTTLSTELTSPDIQTAIIGSWQIIEKGLEVEMHDQHACSQIGDNTTSAKTTTVVQWNNATIDETQNFEQNGDYNSYLKSILSCQGFYKIDNNGDLVIKNNCQILNEKIIELTSAFLTVKEGTRYFKYRKVN
jgi:hypothetical protein